jgi:hypothetical protein
MPDFYIPIWMRGTPLAFIYEDAYGETGDSLLALEDVRASDAYSSLFAGNVRPDGSLRYEENTYQNIMESYEDTIISAGLNPDIFRDQMVGMLEGNTSPAEFNTRVESVRSRMIGSNALPEVAAFYADNYGIEMTDSAILASLLDPDIGEGIVSERLAVSEVGAEAAVRNFDIDLGFAQMLTQYGIEGQYQAAEFFGQAGQIVPAMSVLAARHADPNDTFDLDTFAAAALRDDPIQLRRMSRLRSQESSTFTGGAQVDYVRGQSGGVTGLAQR